MSQFSKGNILKGFMEANNITAQELADKVYVPLEVVEAWLSGATKIDLYWVNITQQYPELNQAMEKAVRAEVERRRQNR